MAETTRRGMTQGLTTSTGFRTSILLTVVVLGLSGCTGNGDDHGSDHSPGQPEAARREHVPQSTTLDVPKMPEGLDSMSAWTTDPGELLEMYSERTSEYERLLADAEKSVVEWKFADGERMEWLPLNGLLERRYENGRIPDLSWNSDGRSRHGLDADGKIRIIGGRSRVAGTDMVVVYDHNVTEAVSPTSLTRFRVDNATSYKSVNLSSGRRLYEHNCLITPGSWATMSTTHQRIDVPDSPVSKDQFDYEYELTADNSINRAYEVLLSDAGPFRSLFYVAPNSKSAAELIETLQSAMVDAVTRHLESIEVNERLYAVILSYWEPEWEDPLWLTAAPESYRISTLEKAKGWEHLWIPDEMLVEFVDGKMFKTDVYNGSSWSPRGDSENRLAEAIMQVHYFCEREWRRDDSVFGLESPFRTAAFGAARQLNQVDWSKHYKITDDFAIVVVHQTSDALREELRRSMPPERFELLRSRGRIQP